jgi:hypothetical protein
MPGRHLAAFVATRRDDVPAQGGFLSVDGSVPGASETWDHHVTGERINLDAMPLRLDPAPYTAIGTTLADTDALACVVAARAGGEGALPDDVRVVLRAASERCDHLVAWAGAPAHLQEVADALHRHVQQALAAAGPGEVSTTFARLCDEVTAALEAGTPLPGAAPDATVAAHLRRLEREARVRQHAAVAALDLRGLPDLPADALHALHAAPVAVFVRDHPQGGVAYTVGVHPGHPQAPDDLTPILVALAAAELQHGPPCARASPGPGSENWGGRRTVFGSPWNYGSRLTPEEVVACVAAHLNPTGAPPTPSGRQIA